MFDGCKSLDEIIEALKEQIKFVQKLKEDGYELIEEVEDDYGHMKKKTTEC